MHKQKLVLIEKNESSGCEREKDKNLFNKLFELQKFSLLIGLLRDGRVTIEDNLVDSSNRPIAASVNFEVRYSSPENMEGNFDSPTVSKSVQQQSLDEDQRMLLDIEQNIANLERTLNQGIFVSMSLELFYAKPFALLAKQLGI